MNGIQPDSQHEIPVFEKHWHFAPEVKPVPLMDRWLGTVLIRVCSQFPEESRWFLEQDSHLSKYLLRKMNGRAR